MRNIADSLASPITLGTGDPNEGLPGSGYSGPRGIEAVLEFNNLYLNVRNWVDTYLVTQIGGLDDADVRDTREVNPGYHGETQFPSYYGGRTIALTGKIYCKTIFKLRDMQQALRQAFSPIDDEYPLIFRTNDANLDLQIYCKKSQSIQMTDEQRTANHFERNFLVTLRASNPRFVSVLRIPIAVTFPGASFDAIAFTAVNNGNFPAQPEINLTGPMNAGARFINETNNNQIALTAAIPSGETWRLDTTNRRMYRVSDMANRFQYLDVNSDWMEFNAGSNSVRFTASGLTAASRINTYHRHTVM